MCRNNDNARKIAAAARTFLTKMVKEGVLLVQPTTKDITETPFALQFACALIAYEEAGILTVDECGAWWVEWKNAVTRGAVDTVTCDDCCATIPTDLVTVLGDGDLCLCAGCKDRTCAPLTTADAERGWDGHGDFEDTPDFQRGTPVELD